MSAEAAVTVPTVSLSWEWTRRRARVFRLAFGMTLSAAVAFGLAWPMAFLTPVLAAKLLSLPKVLPLKAGLGFIVLLAVTLFLGTRILLPTLDYPLVYLLLIGLVIFLLFYAKAGGTNPVLVVLLLLGALAVPLLGTVSDALAFAVAEGLIFAAVVSVVILYVSAAVFPDPHIPPGIAAAEAAKKVPKEGTPDTRTRAVLALRSTAVLYPLAIVIQMFSRVDLTIVLVQVALLSLEPTFGKHLRAGAGLILANLTAGLVAVVIYQLLLFVPSFTFFLLLVLLAGLWAGKWIFSDHVLGKLLSAGITAVFIILGPAIMGDADAGAELASRIFWIMFAVVYVVMAFGLLERLTRGRRLVA